MANIRNLKERDWNQFQLIELDTFPSDPLSKNEYLQIILNDGFFGLFENDHLVGYLYCRIYDSYAHLHRIGILKTERGKKFGSLLFQKAVQYFNDHEKFQFSLFVEYDNFVAISLYKKYGLIIDFESWHFIIDLEQHYKISRVIISNVIIRDLSFEDVSNLNKFFPKINLDEIRGMLKEIKRNTSTNRFIILEHENEPKVIARFNKNYSGCRPFFLTEIRYFDTFIEELVKLKDPSKSYIRITFDDNDELASICKGRKYMIHHHLLKMTKNKPKD